MKTLNLSSGFVATVINPEHAIFGLNEKYWRQLVKLHCYTEFDIVQLRYYHAVTMQPNAQNVGSEEQTISQALNEVRSRIAQAEHERAELDRTIAAAREEERLLLRIVALRQGKVSVDPNASLHQGDGDAPRPKKATDAAPSKQPAVQAVVHELATAGRPLHISDLMRLLREQRVVIPGAGSQANLITHLRRDPRLVRPSRGMYGLAAWGLENMSTKTQRKKRRRRVRAKAEGERN